MKWLDRRLHLTVWIANLELEIEICNYENMTWIPNLFIVALDYLRQQFPFGQTHNKKYIVSKWKRVFSFFMCGVLSFIFSAIIYMAIQYLDLLI